MEEASDYLDQAFKIAIDDEAIDSEHWIYPLIHMQQARIMAANQDFEPSLFVGLKALRKIEELFGEGDGRARRLRVHLASLLDRWRKAELRPRKNGSRRVQALIRIILPVVKLIMKLSLDWH